MKTDLEKIRSILDKAEIPTSKHQDSSLTLLRIPAEYFEQDKDDVSLEFVFDKNGMLDAIHIDEEEE